MSLRPDHPLNRWLAASTDPQRAALLIAQLALALYVVFALLQQIEVCVGMLDQRASLRLTVFYLTGALAFVVFNRSGVNRRFQSDPALLQAQCLFAIAAACGGYLIQGPERGALISVVALILVFGMFELTATQTLRVSAVALFLLGGVMLWKVLADPSDFPPQVELVHFLLSTVVLCSIALLSVRLARMRKRLDEQNAALSLALDQISRLAIHDDLTGLANRRHMAERLASEKLRHERAGQAMSLVLIDIDLFKRINDELGHSAGDAVLKIFADTAAASLRAGDLLARWGGEEFLLMLPDTAANAALLCVQRMRERLSQASFDAVRPHLRITFSAGLSVLGASDTVETLVERADQAMYDAKRAGRNRTVVA